MVYYTMPNFVSQRWIPCHLERTAFDFYYETFGQERFLAEDAEKYGNFNRKLLAEFANKSKLEEEIGEVVAAALEARDIIGSLA